MKTYSIIFAFVLAIASFILVAGGAQAKTDSSMNLRIADKRYVFTEMRIEHNIPKDRLRPKVRKKRRQDGRRPIVKRKKRDNRRVRKYRKRRGEYRERRSKRRRRHYHNPRYRGRRGGVIILGPFYDDRPRRRISCRAGIRRLRRQGFYNIRAYDCRGSTYGYYASRYGKRYKVRMRSRNGAIKSVKRRF